MISANGLAKSFGGRVLFAGASFRLNPGERYGLVGANGSGKTTLLRILAGDATASAGEVSVPKRVRLGVLRQDQFLHRDEPILQVALMGNRELWEAMEEKEKLLAAAEGIGVEGAKGAGAAAGADEAAGEFDAERFSVLEEIVQSHDGYAAESRAGAILEGLGIPASIHRDPLSTLSGGFRLRVLLAQVLAGAPDALLLDEPTNHLDILSIRWLEKFLREFPGPMVLVSHDHRFLDNVVTHILDVDYETVLYYPGGFEEFRAAKAEERGRREKEIATREREIAHHQKFVDRFRAKATKARQAQSRVRLIEKKADALVELPRSSRRWPTFRFEQARPSGKEVVRVTGVSKSYGDNQVLDGVELEVVRGDRLAVMGPNGIGKSTLLKIMTGRLEADAGSVEWGYETRPGYFAQDQEDHFRSLRRRAEAWVGDFCDGRDRGYVRGMMGRMLFSGDDAEKPLKALSGGEAARLVFCSLMIQAPNVLVLDEPTNHLDMESIEALVDGLGAYEGTLVFVSHDRWFVSRLANRIVEITPEGVREYRGSYDEYVHFCGDDHLDVDRVVLKAKAKTRAARRKDGAPRSGVRSKKGRRGPPSPKRARPTSPGPSRRSSRDGRSRELRRRNLIKRIEELEARLLATDRRLADPETYANPADGKAKELVEQREIDTVEVERLMADWEELEAEIEEGNR